MQLTPGSRLGPYEIIAPLGAGGMGEVYRARDTRLGREVAIKVLPQHLADQPEIRARFEREARTISTLNHPHICLLFDVGHEGDALFLVMELIEGETLADRLLRGALPASELLRYGTQVADALDRAHRAGVVHRDLKPGNIMLTRGGAKLMDFGLSRMTGLAGGMPGSASAATLAKSPTIAQALTAEGTLLGTFQYMAPEQLEGKEADTRSDIWALGCVLYEMATGRRAFEGRSQASLIAAILEREPAAVGEMPSGSGVVAPSAPPHGIERLIRNCLAKDPEERIQTAHDVKLQLQNIADMAGVSGVAAAPASGIAGAPFAVGAARRSAGAGGASLAWGVAALVAVLAAAGFAWLLPRTHVTAPAVRFRIAALPGMTQMYWPRISPDGKFLVVDGLDSTNTPRAYVRPLDQLELHPIPGTENLTRAYWSPDSKEITFIASGKLQRVSIGGGSPVVVCAAPGTADLSWGAKGFILLDGAFTDSLRSVPASGGDLKPATRIDRAAHEVGTAWPCFLPDGEHFLFIGNLPNSTGGDIRLGTIGSLDSKLLGHSDGRVEYGPGGWVLFVRQTTLLAQKLDLGRGKLVGEPITLVDDLRIGDAEGHFSISGDGILAFSRTGNGEDAALVEAKRDGIVTGPPLASGLLADPRLSPDGHRLLFERGANTINAGGEIHVVDLDRHTETRLTFTGDNAANPQWSPDGTRYSYEVTTPGAVSMLHLASADGLGAQDSIPLPGRFFSQSQWAAAGFRIAFDAVNFHAYSVPTEGTPRVATVLGDPAQQMAQMQISPDGRWLAYTFGTSANGPEVYVQSLVGPPGRWQITSAPSINPHWTKGGKELVYEALSGHLEAVPIDGAASFRAGAPTVLFHLPQTSSSVSLTSWGVSEDGERFFLVVPPHSANAGVVELVTNFEALVGRR